MPDSDFAGDFLAAALGTQTMTLEAAQALAEIGFKNWELGCAISLEALDAMLFCSGVETFPRHT